MKFTRMPDCRISPDAKKEIKALATPALKEEYATVSDALYETKHMFLESVIRGAGWDLNSADRPDQWKRVIGWLKEEMPDEDSNR